MMPQAITIRLTTDQNLRDGFFLDSFYVDEEWGPIIGPSCVMLLKAIERNTDDQTRQQVVATKVLAQQIGVGSKRGTNSAIWQTILRLVTFHLARWADDAETVLEIRDRMPAVGCRTGWPNSLVTPSK